MAVKNGVAKSWALPAYGDGKRYSYPDVTAPAQPANRTATAVSDTEIEIDFDFPTAAAPASAILGCRLYRGTATGGPYTFITGIAAVDLPYSDTSLTPDTEYFYKVSTIDAAGNETALGSCTEFSETTSAGGGGSGEPAIRTLELISPIASGTGTPAMHSGHRIYKAYPGIAYNIRCVVTGGSYPYTFALTNAPSGMTINANTGEINWPSPTTGQSGANPTVTVTDAESTQVQGSWTIAVTTSGFKFIDAVNGTALPNGTGTLANPIRTLADVKNGGATFSDILYFRAGNYTLGGDTPGSGASLNGAGYLNLGFDDSGGTGRPMTWIAYPGESPNIDFRNGLNTYGSVNGPFDAPYIKLTGPNIYIDGLTISNDRTKSFELDCTTRRAPVIRNVTALNGGSGSDGSNSAFFMLTANASGPSYGLAIQDCDFGEAQHNAIKSYSMTKSVIEDNQFTDNDGVAQKAGVSLYTVRRNTFTTCNYCVTGNMNVYGAETTGGEVCYNLMLNPVNHCLAIGNGKISTIGQTNVYRNTFVGPVWVQNLVTADGPYVFRHNVKINSDGAQTPWANIVDTSISDASRVTIDDDLNGAAADNIVNASGLLQGAYRTTYLGTRGHEIA